MQSLREIIQKFFSEHFGLIQIGISAFFVFIWFRAKHREESQSRFRVREADRDLRFKRGPAETASAEAMRKKEPLRLDGIVADGAPHEVLGISALATEAEIQKAYKERMKRFHPDLIGRPGSREWTEATKIAEAINRARTTMLEKLKRRS